MQRLNSTSYSGLAWIEDVGAVLRRQQVDKQTKLVGMALDDLAKLRIELALPAPGPGSKAFRLAIGGKTFYGWSGGKDIAMRVNPVSRFHAEADVFQQALNAGMTGEATATLYVDYPGGLCLACAGNDGVDTLARQLGLREVQVVGPNFSHRFIFPP
jgi:MafB19-like deaminase